jgi:hypothetical protein
MKGQISFVEYLASLVLFLTAVIFIALQLINFVPQYLTEINNQRIKINAYQISELLVNDPGNPINWYQPSSKILRMGLSSESVNKTDYLSLQKITAFNSYCNAAGGYNNIKNNIGAVSNFAILLFNRTAGSGNLLIVCQPPELFSSSINTTIRRIVAIDSNDIGELIVQSG